MGSEGVGRGSCCRNVQEVFLERYKMTPFVLFLFLSATSLIVFLDNTIITNILQPVGLFSALLFAFLSGSFSRGE